MFRIALSPKGDMHIQDLQIALFNYILSRQKKEELIIRIEDIDIKDVKENDAKTVGLLELFGITYKEVLYQSKNLKFYSAMALDLLHRKKAFNCFCPSEILEKQEVYDGTCENLPAELVIDNPNPFSVRIKKPTSSIDFNDHIKGEIKIEQIDSFMILKSNKTPTYDFAHGVDDMLNNISFVIQCDTCLKNTAKQIHIRKSLRYDKEIQYAHLPCIQNGKNISITQLLKNGYLPQAIVNYVILLTSKTPKKLFTLDEAMDWFDLKDISKNSADFNISDLAKINKEYLLKMDSKELSTYVGFADEEIGNLAKLYLDEVKTTKELKSKIKAYFELKNISLDKNTKKLKGIIKQAPFFERYEDFLNHLTKESKLDPKEISSSLKTLFGDKETTLDISQIYSCIKNYLLEIVK